MLFGALMFCCNTVPKGFTIDVHVSDVSDGTIFYLMNPGDNTVLDSCYTRNGAFFLKGHLAGKENLILHATDSITKEFIYTFLLIGNEHVTLNANKSDFPWNIDATGSESQDVAEKFNRVEYQRQQLNKNLRANIEKLRAENKDEEH
ncbi:MAG: hypothetical protein C0490_11415, partial [Marivirga sp.]|nr:hypothetical protein [Marivirga sp.]